MQISRELLWSLAVTTLQTDAALTDWKEDYEWWVIMSDEQQDNP